MCKAYFAYGFHYGRSLAPPCVAVIFAIVSLLTGSASRTPTTAAETRSAQSGPSSAHNSAGRSATNIPRILHGSTQLLPGAFAFATGKGTLPR
ncbi:hypothetical protein V8E53_000307 [Lactarius tabidus]